MTIRAAINGFGRIGRTCLRALFEAKRQDIEIVAVNSRGSIEMSAHLLRYDTVHGRFNADFELDGNNFIINGKKIVVSNHSNIADIAWKDLDIDVVLECTGKFKTREQTLPYLELGAKKVLISAPSKDCDRTIVFGVNEKELLKSDKIVSNASCTTNCLAPVAKVLHENIGIKNGFMTTVHSYTSDQPTLDKSHNDFYRARAAACSIIPTTTGAAKATALVLPDLKGKLDGVAVRVPTPNVSMVDLVFNAQRSTNEQEINQLMRDAANGELKGVLSYSDEKLVSSDFIHDPHSSIFHCDQTKVMDGTLCRIVSWYDNEWGFSNRMLDTACAMMKASK